MAFVGGIVVFNYLSRITIVSGEIPIMGERELVDEASVIVYGKVVEIYKSKWANPNFEKGEHIANKIYTDVLIEVKKIYKGEPYDKKEIIVRAGYGKVGNEEVFAADEPTFKVGEEMILFLRDPYSLADDTSESYYKTVGLLQGQFKLKEEKNNDKIFENGTKKNTLKLSSVENDIKEIIKDLEKRD